METGTVRTLHCRVADCARSRALPPHSPRRRKHRISDTAPVTRPNDSLPHWAVLRRLARQAPARLKLPLAAVLIALLTHLGLVRCRSIPDEPPPPSSHLPSNAPVAVTLATPAPVPETPISAPSPAIVRKAALPPARPASLQARQASRPVIQEQASAIALSPALSPTSAPPLSASSTASDVTHSPMLALVTHATAAPASTASVPTPPAWRTYPTHLPPPARLSFAWKRGLIRGEAILDCAQTTLNQAFSVDATGSITMGQPTIMNPFVVPPVATPTNTISSVPGAAQAGLPVDFPFTASDANGVSSVQVVADNPFATPPASSISTWVQPPNAGFTSSVNSSIPVAMPTGTGANQTITLTWKVQDRLGQVTSQVMPVTTY